MKDKTEQTCSEIIANIVNEQRKKLGQGVELDLITHIETLSHCAFSLAGCVDALAKEIATLKKTSE